jgi:hypothetical protein
MPNEVRMDTIGMSLADVTAHNFIQARRLAGISDGNALTLHEI